MDTKTFISSIRDLIANGDLTSALLRLQKLLENSPKLDEVLLLSARYQELRKQIRKNTISNTDADITQNQIRNSVLNLLREVEETVITAANTIILDSSLLYTGIEEYVKPAADIIDSKNVALDTNINAGGDVHIGDINIVNKSGYRLNPFTLFIPLLIAIVAAYCVYQYQQIQQPLTLSVSLDNKKPSPELPFEGGMVALELGDKLETLHINQDAYFKGIPPGFRGKSIRMIFNASGFEKIDTNFVLSDNHITLPIYRNNSLSRVFGTVKDEQGVPIEGAQIRVQDLFAVTTNKGVFEIIIPFNKQRKEQRIEAFKQGYLPWDYTSPVLMNEEVSIILISR